MAYTTINKFSEYFNNKIYTGNGSTNAITGVGFQPDMSWTKIRSETGGHRLVDAVRGNTKYIYPNANDAEATVSTNVTSFNSDGYTLGNGSINESARTYVSWNWKANGSSTTTNNDGATTSYISHNSTGKFSIIKYTGTGSNTNIGHGLNGTPDYFIVKGSSGATDWHVWCNNFPSQKRIKLNSTGGWSTNTSIFASLPDATKIYFGGGGDVNGSGVEYICYAWKNVTGFSKAGSYKGNGNADGSFVYTGFKPTFLFYRNVSATENWEMADNQRSPENLDDKLILYANGTNADVSTTRFDFLSNGFKARSINSAVNASGNEYMYLAFGQTLVGSNNVPCTAR